MTIAHTRFYKSRVGDFFLFSDWCAGNGCSETRHPSVSVSPYPDHGIAHFSLIAEAEIE